MILKDTLRIQFMFHETAVNGGGVVWGKFDTEEQRDKYVQKFNAGVQKSFEKDMADVEAIDLGNEHETDLAKRKYGAIAEARRNSDLLKPGQFLEEGATYQHVNPAFSSNDHALTVVHGAVARREGSWAYTEDGGMSDGLHEHN